MQRPLKTWLFDDNGGFKTLPQANIIEGFKGNFTPHLSKPLACFIVCFTKMNKKVYKTSECWYSP
jgi:hypothetical protein